MEEESAIEIENPIKNKKRKKKLLLALILLAAVISVGGIGGAFYWFINRSFSAVPNIVTFESEGGQATIKIEGPSNWRVLNTPKPWCSVSWQDNILFCSVSENNYHQRGDTIRIGNDNKSCSIIIQQESGAFYCNSSNQSIQAGGGSTTFQIYGRTDWTIAEGPESWGSAYKDGSTLIWRVQENHGDSRSDYVVLKSGSKEIRLTISQPGALKAEKYEIKPSSGATTQRIKIYGPDDWDCQDSEYWIDVEREGDCVKIEIEKNEDDYKREGTVTISGGGQKIEINVIQSAKSSSSGSWYYPWYY